MDVRTNESWVGEYEVWLRTSKGKSGYRRNQSYIGTTLGRIRSIVEGCGFRIWHDIRKATVENFVGGLDVKQRTLNGYIKALKSFCTWCVRDGRAEFSPVQYLDLVTVPDKETRRALSFDEVCRLLTTTAKRSEPSEYVRPGAGYFLQGRYRERFSAPGACQLNCRQFRCKEGHLDLESRLLQR